jgi:hypothetical protein
VGRARPSAYVRTPSASRSDMTSWPPLLAIRRIGRLPGATFHHDAALDLGQEDRRRRRGAPEPTAAVPSVRRRRVLEAQTGHAMGAAIGSGWDPVERNGRVGICQRARSVVRARSRVAGGDIWAQPVTATSPACASVVSHTLPSVPVTSPIDPPMIRRTCPYRRYYLGIEGVVSPQNGRISPEIARA